jgi:hypothetical protein
MTGITHEDEICRVFFIHNSLIIYTECFLNSFVHIVLYHSDFIVCDDLQLQF